MNAPNIKVYNNKRECEEKQQQIKYKLKNKDFNEMDDLHFYIDSPLDTLNNIKEKIIDFRDNFKRRKNTIKSINGNDNYDKYLDRNLRLPLWGKSFNNTFKYLFQVVGKGVYVKIYKNKIVAFRPFINQKISNDWGKNISFEFKGRRLPNYDIYKKVSRSYKKDTHNDPSKWMSNNCLVDNPKVFDFWGTRFMEFYFLLSETLKRHLVNDCEFFFNKRDFPIVRKDLKHPAQNLFKNDPVDYSHKYKNLLPIVGYSASNIHCDFMVPTDEDVSMVFQKFMTLTCENMYYGIKDNIQWKDKINKAVFRGKATGCGITIATNQRLKLTNIASKMDSNIIDAGITKWNARDKVNKGVVSKIMPWSFPFRPKPFMSRDEQMQHKYLISVDGHVRPFRVPFELGTNSVVLLVDSLYNYKCWWDELLEPNVHYIPIKADLSDLEDKIRWCIANDQKCKEISDNATKWYNKYMTPDGICNVTARALTRFPQSFKT